MLTQARISSGSFSVGMSSVDSSQVRGEGGAVAPMLVIPLNVELDQRPKEERLALLRLEVALWLPSARGTFQLGSPVVVFGDGSGGGIWHTAETHDFQTRIELRFPITLEMLRLIEETVHAMQAPNLGFTLKIKPAVAHVVASEELTTAHGMPGQVHILGSAFELRPLAWQTVDQLEVHLSREQWADIAKGLGLEEIRLVAVRLPKGVAGLDPKLVSLFDDAVARYERRDYRSAIGTCRDIRALVEQALGATKGNPVADVLAAERGLGATSPPIQFAGGAWKLLAESTNAAHHGQSVGVYDAADVRAVLLLTAVLLEYLADSLRRRL
jgi:hypothetical protein